MISQKSVQQFESECKRAKIFVDNDTPIGVFHDFLIKIKGQMVDIMTKNQKDEEEKQLKDQVIEDDKS